MNHPLLNIRRIFKTSFQGITRNMWFAVASTTVMTLTLVTVSAFFILSILVNKAADTAKEKVGLASVNLKEWVADAEIAALKTRLKEIPGVTEVNFVSKEEALNRFKEIHKNDKLLLEAVAEENPLFNSLEVRVADPDDFKKVKALLASRSNASYIEDFSFDGDREATIARIGSVSNFIKQLGVGLSLIFVLVASVIIFNTIRLGIFSRRAEIEIMYLNGATRSYIRSPFLIEGALYGIFAIIITAVIGFFLIDTTGQALTQYFGDIGDIKSYVYENLRMFSSALLFVGVGVGLISSSLAVSKHLEV